MMNEKPFFDKQTTSCLKGLMLILMFILHFFCFPDWYVDGVAYPRLAFMEGMQGHFQICVAGFAFLTGYFYDYAKKKDLRYSAKKILGVMIPYWCVYAVYLLIAVLTKTADLSPRAILMEIVSLDLSVMGFCWYVSFYLLSMLALPLLKLICRNSRLAFCLLGIFGPIALYYGVAHFVSIHWITALLEKFQVYFPIIVIGYAAASISLFERIDRLIEKIPLVLKAVLAFAFVLIVFFEPGWLYGIPLEGFVFSMARKMIRIASIPFFIYGLIVLFNLVKHRVILKPLEVLGKYSLLMWFAHSLFFGCSKEIFQKVLFWPGNPLLVLIWGLLLNFGIAWVFHQASSRLTKRAISVCKL